MKQIKTKKRVKDFGEVFTNEREVKAMCDLIPNETWDNIASTFLEPCCGNGNFLVEIYRRKLELCRYENYNGIDFCDVSAGGIQIRLHHKEICGYTVGQQFTLKYDLSNRNEAIEFVVSEFKRIDDNKYISGMKDFIRVGEATRWH